MCEGPPFGSGADELVALDEARSLRICKVVAELILVLKYTLWQYNTIHFMKQRCLGGNSSLHGLASRAQH